LLPRECKRLAEVDFPVAEVSRQSVKEKAIRFGHPATLHMWWARRPSAACRAVLLALILPDPCDLACPQDFKVSARKILSDSWRPVGPSDSDLRTGLLKYIAEFAAWERSTDPMYLRTARLLVRAVNPDEPPTVVDPFAGGGAIPLEALRIGCETFATDLNPVACLILKLVLELIPRWGPGLVDEFRDCGQKLTEEYRRLVKELYPPEPDGAEPIAYVWARTVRCETPGCGAELPLLRSVWLGKKSNRRVALRYRVEKRAGEVPVIRFEIFEPQSESEVQSGTVSQAKALCPCCSKTLPPDRVRAQLSGQGGGANVLFNGQRERVGGARLMAVVLLREGKRGRSYREPTDGDYLPLASCLERIKKNDEGSAGSSHLDFPNEFISTPKGTEYKRGDPYYNFFPILNYGITRWRDLLNARQLVALSLLGDTVRQMAPEHVRFPLSLCLSKYAELVTANCPWEPVAECPRKTFNLQAIPVRWEYAEGVCTSHSSGSFETVLDNFCSTLAAIGSDWNVGQSQLADACVSPLQDGSCQVWFTDPPYYDAIPYSDLSDFFFVWLKRILPANPTVRDPYDKDNPLTPKTREIIDNLELMRGVPKAKARSLGIPAKDRKFFEDNMRTVFREGYRVLSDQGICCVVFAHKTTEGWEALLSGMLEAGWVIKASWPISTEQAHRPRARDSAALATSVHLVCRPRIENLTGEWGAVLGELPLRVSDWMRRLQMEGIRGADLVFACIGPALEIFSRYSSVETPEGRVVGLSEYLQKVWEVVGRIALEEILGSNEVHVRQGSTGSLEEDARLTALFLWTMQSTSPEDDEPQREDSVEEEESDIEGDEASSSRKKPGLTLIYDVVRRFAQPLGIHLPDWEGRIIETKKGVVRLIPVQERSERLFGEAGADVVADRIESTRKGVEQLDFFAAFGPGEGSMPEVRQGEQGVRSPSRVADEALRTSRDATTLDRVHAAMLLQAGGRANALRAFLAAEVERSPDFLRLANSLSALYPKASEEKRLLDAMLLAIPR
jgi:putative DNA methylase